MTADTPSVQFSWPVGLGALIRQCAEAVRDCAPGSTTARGLDAALARFCDDAAGTYARLGYPETAALWTAVGTVLTLFGPAYGTADIAALEAAHRSLTAGLRTLAALATMREGQAA